MARPFRVPGDPAPAKPPAFPYKPRPNRPPQPKPKPEAEPPEGKRIYDFYQLYRDWLAPCPERMA